MGLLALFASVWHEYRGQPPFFVLLSAAILKVAILTPKWSF
jgi:hypothetical protein